MTDDRGYTYIGVSKYNPDTWNYDKPMCLWEELPWQLRWPGAIGTVFFFVGAFLLPFVGLVR